MILGALVAGATEPQSRVQPGERQPVGAPEPLPPGMTASAWLAMKRWRAGRRSTDEAYRTLVGTPAPAPGTPFEKAELVCLDIDSGRYWQCNERGERREGKLGDWWTE